MKMVKTLADRPFVRNVIAVASGSAAAQAITVAAAPVITRLYGAEAFGVQGIFMSLLSIAGPIAALTYPVSIVLPKNDETARSIALLSLILSGIFSLFVLALLLSFGNILIEGLKLGSIGILVYALPLAMFFTSTFQVSHQWLIRTGQFKFSAKTAVANAFVSNAGRIILGVWAPIAGSLVFIASITPAMHSVMIGGGMSRERSLFGTLSTIRLAQLAQDFRDFPLFRAPAAMLSAASIALPTILLGVLHSPEAAGFYVLARTVLKLPGTLLAKSVGDVLYPRYAQAAHGGELKRLLLGSVKGLALACALPFGFVALSGPWLFEFVFGHGWHVAGEYAQWIAVWLYVNFALSPATQIFPVLRRQKSFLFFRIVSVIVTTSALLAGFLFWSSDLAAVALYCISGAVMTAIMFVYSISLCRDLVSPAGHR